MNFVIYPDDLQIEPYILFVCEECSMLNYIETKLSNLTNIVRDHHVNCGHCSFIKDFTRFELDLFDCWLNYYID